MTFLPVLALLCSPTLGQAPPGQAKPQTPAWIPGTNIQRTMQLLASSTQDHPNHVKILFYGQYISQQDWWIQVASDLKQRFPFADIVCENRAIDGFKANLLKRVVMHDVYPSYPDLIIFQDYGAESDYEQIIRALRANVASEILIQSDHIDAKTPLGTATQKGWRDPHEAWLRGMAEKYNLGFVNVRSSWRHFLLDHKYTAGALLKDNVHLNDAGCNLMASLVERALVVNLNSPPDPNLCRTFAAPWSGNSMKLAFDGNRVDLVLGGPVNGHVKVLIDGKAPSSFPELYQFDRPSDCPGVEAPALFHVESRQPLQVENWTLTLSNIASNASRWHFALSGDKTGADGEGESGQTFVSNSGRVAIDPMDWYISQAYGLGAMPPPEGFQIHWRVIPQFMDEVPNTATGTITIAQGLPNMSHQLELVSDGDPPQIAGVTIYRPPIKTN